MSVENTYELIENYLNNLLSPDELAIVETRLKNDPLFLEEVSAHRMANELIFDNALLDIKQELKKIHVEDTRKSKLKKAYLLGSLAVGIIITGVLLYNNTEENNTTIVNKSDSVIQQDLVSTKTNAVENNKNDLNKTQEINNTKSTQNNITEQNSKTPSESIAAALPQPAKNNSLPIEVNKNIEPNSNRNNSSNNENEKANVIIPVTSATTITTKSPCEDIIIKPEYTVDQATGDITIDTKLTEGNPPFQYSIDGGKTFYPQNEFRSIGLEKYLLVIMDQQKCKSDLIEVKIPTTMNYVIYPDNQKFWEISLIRFEGNPVTIKISNARTAVVVYQTTISGTSDFVWYGTDQNSNPLLMGNYVYEISSLKSSLVLSGLITIVR